MERSESTPQSLQKAHSVPEIRSPFSIECSGISLRKESHAPTLTVIVLGNLNGGAPDQIASSIGKVSIGQTVTLNSERKPVAVLPALLSEYVGTYHMTDAPIDDIIAIKDGHLTSTLAKQPELDLFAESETKFYLKVVDAQVEFFRDRATHAVNRLVIYQGGAEHEGKKE
jgi:hypothetical protein